MVTITLKGREIPLLYTTQEMLTIQEKIGPIKEVIYKATGTNPESHEDESFYATSEHLQVLSKLTAILGNAGLEENGMEPDLTEKKVLRAIKPTEISFISNKCMECMEEGMQSEIPAKEPEGPIDVTLEEMNKKKVKDE